MDWLLYRSRAAHHFSARHLLLLLSRVRLANLALGLTGRLCYRDGCFFEYVEGPAEAIDSVWSRVRSDPRHGEIELLQRSSAPARRYDDWAIAFACDGQLRGQHLSGYLPRVDEALADLFGRCGLDPAQFAASRAPGGIA